MYNLRIHVEESGFEGGGYGGFLTYLGALKLRDDVAKRGAQILQSRHVYFPKTTCLLDVVDPTDGYEKTLRIVGENLHGNHNNCYWPKMQIPREALSPKTGRTLTVSLTGASSYVDDQDATDAEYIERRLDFMKTWGMKPIGYLGIYTIHDYVPADVPLDLHGRMIHLGRYGPFQNKGTM